MNIDKVRMQLILQLIASCGTLTGIFPDRSLDSTNWLLVTDHRFNALPFPIQDMVLDFTEEHPGANVHLYQVGHQDNRRFFAIADFEDVAENRVIYPEYLTADHLRFLEEAAASSIKAHTLPNVFDLKQAQGYLAGAMFVGIFGGVLSALFHTPLLFYPFAMAGVVLATIPVLGSFLQRMAIKNALNEFQDANVTFQGA